MNDAISFAIRFNQKLFIIFKNLKNYGCSASIWRSDITRAIEMAKIFVGRPAIGRSEFVGENFGAHAINSTRKVAISNSSTTGLNAPERLTKGSHSGAWVKDDFCPIKAVGPPI